MSEDIMTIVDEIGRKEGIPEGIQFKNMYCKSKSTFSDLYANDNPLSSLLKNEFQYYPYNVGALILSV